MLAIPGPASAAELPECLGAPDGKIAAVATASRTSGVAPLLVYFDARETSAPSPIRPFHDLEFRWDFGDPESGAWRHGSRAGSASRNHATGAVAAHLFERPGRYLVVLEVGGAGSVTVRRCLQITAFDPDAFFVGDRTICLTAGGDFAGCPAGARQIARKDGNLATALRDHGGPSRRILLRRGESWQAPEPAVIRWPGPGILGAYGIGERPRIAAAADSGAAVLQISSPTTPDVRDWRVMDLRIDGKSHRGRSAVKAEGGASQVTLLRMDLSEVRNGILFSSSVLDWHNRTPAAAGHRLWDQIAVVDSTTSEIVGTSGAYSAYVSATRLALLGNSFDNGGGGEHTVRLPSVVFGVVGHNNFRGQGRAAGGKHALTLRAAVHGSSGVEGGHDSQWVVVSDNRFHGAEGSDWTVTYQPQAAADERVVDVVTERNWFIAGPGTQFSLVLFARNQTVRNNLFDLSGGRSHGGILIHDGLTVGSRAISIYNNSFRSTDSSKDFVALLARPEAAEVVARNNLAHAPGVAQARMLSGPIIAASNSSDTQVRSSPSPYAGADATGLAAWQPSAGGHAIGAGSPAPVHSDFNARPRPIAPQHLGAMLP